MPWNVEPYLSTLNSSTANRYRAALDDFHRWYIGTYGDDPDLWRC